MAVKAKKLKAHPVKRKPLKKDKPVNAALRNDPNAVHDIYNEDDLDPDYDKTIADDIAFDNN